MDEQQTTPPAPNNATGTTHPDAALASLAFWSFVIPIPFASLIIPLVLLNTKGKDSPLVRDASVEALNFLIFSIIAFAVGAVLIIVVIGIFVLIAVYLYVLIFSIVGAVKTMSATNESPPFRFPLSIRFIN